VTPAAVCCMIEGQGAPPLLCADRGSPAPIAAGRSRLVTGPAPGAPGARAPRFACCSRKLLYCTVQHGDTMQRRCLVLQGVHPPPTAMHGEARHCPGHSEGLSLRRAAARAVERSAPRRGRAHAWATRTWILCQRQKRVAPRFDPCCQFGSRALVPDTGGGLGARAGGRMYEYGRAPSSFFRRPWAHVLASCHRQPPRIAAVAHRAATRGAPGKPVCEGPARGGAPATNAAWSPEEINTVHLCVQMMEQSRWPYAGCRSSIGPSGVPTQILRLCITTRSDVRGRLRGRLTCERRADAARHVRKWSRTQSIAGSI